MEKLKKFSALLTAFLLLFSFIDANMFSAAAEPLKDYLFEKESFTYSETVDFKKFPEETNVKSLSGDVVAEFDLCIPSQRENEDSQMVENLFSDMSLQICDASNKAVSIFTIESKNGYERLRTRTVGNGTQQDFIAYADQVSIKDMWLNFKIEIDTENESVNYTISSDDLGESVEFNELAYYESDSNNQNNAITQVRIAFNRNKKTGFDETSDYYYCEYYIKELQVYSTYTISSIEDISDSVSVGSTFALPEKVSAVTSIGSEVECEVSWVDPVTGESVTEYTPQNEDVRVFYGTVSGYEETVTLTLTPTEPMISEIEPLEVTIFKYEEYQFPNKVTVTLQNNTTREKDVVWKDIQSFDASVVGQYTYEGEVADSDALASITINVVPLEIVSAEPVTINGIYGEYLEFPEKVEVLCADGTTVYEKVIWDIDINSLLDEGTHIISGDIIDCAIDVSAVIIIEKKDVQKDCMFNKETLDQFANLHNQEIILTTSPISTVDPYTYVQKDENGNYYLEYSETREYVSFSDSANKKTLYGDVVVEFDLKIEDSLKDMWIQVHDERKKPVAVITFDSRNGYERVTARLDEGSSTLTAVNFTDNINLKGQWLHFKINIDTIGREYDFRITGENSPAIVMRNVPYYSTDDNPDNDSILRTDIAFNRGVSADSFAASEYYSNKYLIDNIEIYRTYTVKEINDINEIVEVGTTYVFPEKVLALTSYNSYAYCKVVWEDSLTEYTPQAEAETVFYGSVSGYDGKVKLTIKGENFTITEVEPVAYEIFKYGEFDFPEKVNVKIENGQTRNAVVNWIDNEGFDSSKVGEYTYYGQLRGTSVPAQITIKVNPLDIASVDTVELLSRYGEVPLLPEMIKVNLNGDITAYENVSWQFAPISVPAIGVHNIVGEIQDSTVAANGILNVFSNINNKVVNETLANYKEGYALAFAPWSTSNPKIKIEVDGNGDKVAHYFGTHDFLTLAPAQYSGKVISSIRMKMKRNTSEFRYQMMEGTIPMVSVIFLPDGSIKVEGAENENNLFENAYKLNEYFVMDLVVDIDNRVYDIYINGLMVAKNIYFAGSMEGNALKNIRMADRSTSNDSADVYMNNIILYELQAPLRAELESISLESTVKENIALPQKTENGYKILWSSNKPEVINNNGEVTRQDYNASVVLTATLKAEFGMGVTEYKSDYTITVPKRDITDRQIVDAAITELTEDKISQENISSVTEDLSLPLLSASGATINWKSSDEKIITHQGLIIRPASDTTVKLTATVSSGSVSETKEFRITVKKQVGELDSIQCVRHAMASTTIPETISNDIVLPSTAGKSVDVVWYSDNLSILANSGKINKKSKGGKVNLTAVFSKDEYRITKVYPVTVKVTASPSGSSGGGGGGGKSPSTPILGSVVPEIKPSVSSSNSKFPDIGNHAWAEEAINSLSEKGIISGYENGCFYPQNNISREEFVKLTVSAFDIDVIDEDVNFSDVSQDAWFKKYLSTALKNGIVSGYDNGTFGTGNTITRQDMVVMIFNALNNALELNIEESEPAFADNDDIADYAAGKIGALTKLNIISGVGENRFAPLNPATRAEAAKLIYQIILKYYK